MSQYPQSARSAVVLPKPTPVGDVMNCQICDQPFRLQMEPMMAGNCKACKKCHDKYHDSLKGVGPDTPTVTNTEGGKQADVPFRCDLLPPKALLDAAVVLAEGAKKYGEENWRQIPRKDHINHCLMHLYAYLCGDKQEDQLSHVACRILFAMETR